MMKKLLIAVLFFAGICQIFAESSFETDQQVLVGTKDNFDHILQEYTHILVEFYAPWCGHCKALAPEYAKAAQALEKDGSKVKLVKIDATVHTELAEKHMIQGYPTIKFFIKENDASEHSIVNYSGGRLADDIVKWINKKSGPPAIEIKTVEEAKGHIKENPVFILGFFKDLNSDAAKVFLNVARDTEDYAFGITSSEQVIAEYSVQGDTVILFKNPEDEKIHYEGEYVAEQLQKFIAIQSLPLIVEFNQESAKKVFGGEISSHLLLFLGSDPSQKKLGENLKETAKKYQGKILFVTINIDEEDHKRILEFFGIKSDEAPTMRIIKLEKDMAKYKPEKNDLSPEFVSQFVSDFLEGKVKEHLLTQDLPEDWDKKPVKVLVGSNFADVALDPEKNVLVEFYAPWCGHCKQLEPIYEELGEKYKDNQDVVIAKMDATINELKEVKVTSFPTIKLFKKGANTVVEYTGERTLEGLSKFIDSDGADEKVPEMVQEEDEDDDIPRKDEL